MKKTYTVKQVAEALEFSTNTVYKYLSEGKIRATRLGKEGRFRIPEEEVVRLLGLKGGKPQIAPQMEAAQPKEIPSIEQPGEQSILDKIHPPSLFDWFVAMLAIFVSLSYFLFPVYLQEIVYEPYIPYIQASKIGLVVLGIILLATDVFRAQRSFWHRLLHLGLGMLFGVLAYIFFQTGNYATMLGNLAVSLLLLTTAYFKIHDFMRFMILLAFFAVGAGALFLYDPGSFPQQAFAQWISDHKIFFAVSWFTLFIAVFVGGLYGSLHNKPIAILSFLTIAIGSFVYTSLSVNTLNWEKAMFAMLVGSFSLIAPFWRRFESFARLSKKELLEGFAWLIAIFLVGIGLVYYLQQSFKTYVSAENKKSLDTAVQIVESYLSESQNVVVRVGNDEELKNTLTAKTKDFNKLTLRTKAFYSESSRFRRIGIFDAQGKAVAFYPEVQSSIGVVDANTELLQKLKSTSIVVVSDWLKLVNGQPGIVTSAPIVSEGEFVGAVTGLLDLVLLTKQLSDIQFGSGGIFVIADGEKTIISHPNENQVGEKISTNLALTSAVDGEKGELEGYSNNGVLMTQSYASIPSVGWGIVAQQPLLAVLGQQSVVAFTIFLVTVASGIGSLLTIVYLRGR